MCDTCNKVCKSKGGLTRHKKVHGPANDPDQNEEKTQNSLTQECVVTFLKEEKYKAEENSCYSKDLCEKLKECSLNEERIWLLGLDLWRAFKKPYDKLLRNNDAEKFYSYCYSQIVYKSQEYLPDYPEDMSTIILSKMTDKLLLKSKKKEEDSQQPSETESINLSDNEIHGLCYISGYIMHKLHKKMKNSPKWNTKTNQQIISALIATKASEIEEKECESSLIAKLNRGGLWIISDNMKSLMLTTELIYRKQTTILQNRVIEINKIADIIIKEENVVQKWQELIALSEIKVEKHVAKDLLMSIINLYIQIRSFTYAKDIVKKYKQAGKVKKEKALRTEMKRSADAKVND